MNKQPVCDNPIDALITSASGFTLCGSCASHPITGPAWHPTGDMAKKIAAKARQVDQVAATAERIGLDSRLDKGAERKGLQ